MGNIRPQQISNSQAAHDQATTNQANAASANSVPELRVVVAANGDAIQSNTAAIQRLEAIVEDLRRRARGTPAV